MIVLFTDFGPGPYTGQMIAALRRRAPEIDVIDLFSNAPMHDPRAAAYLLPAYGADFPAGTVFVCVVDPGVGGERAAGMLAVDGRWYVGPDNGLFELVLRRSRLPGQWWDVAWRPQRLSATFHGRDLFAPVAARIARGRPIDGRPRAISEIRRSHWPDDLAQIVYRDSFGNGVTGIRAAAVPQGATIAVGGRTLPRARTFSDVSLGDTFWYENANGLVEIAVNQGSADDVMDLSIGTGVAIY